eukprot:CAMPEP_0170522320 /NCGR_PEP_ID=MMETSP0209-20121228/7749_1 /TAXON_ID=665100 ORGANISM="Litonotus pictus, Strain P1" /NCGR_SAMPLE_ID=MMETSP0209 /ASSEMBLY_ACC=CAM_ASM_000301 /LENGTH=735 /DNA_ID=CAMNT_0010809763 /DNA_START=116 /DNA_END=2323 /DNA_ORIENTATION=-
MEFKNDTAITFTVKFSQNRQGWMGLGFGGHLMEKVDYHIFENFRGLNYYDAWSDDFDDPTVDSQQDMKNLKNSIDSNGDLVLIYERNIQTGDQFDHQFVDGNNEFAVAWWDDSLLSDHGSLVRVGSIDIDMANKLFTINSSVYIIWAVHGWGLMISWSILNSFGYIAGRMLTHLPFFKYFHLFTSGLNGLIGFVFAILGLVEAVGGDGGTYSGILAIHLAFGMIFIVFSVIMFITGCFTINVVYGGNLKNDLFLKTKVVHKYMGIFMSWFQILLLVTGSYLLYQKYTLGVIFAAISVVLMGLCELMVLAMSSSKFSMLSKQDKEVHQNIKKMTTKQVRELKESQSKKFVLVDNYLVDMDNYLDAHPGGRNLIEDSLYGDVTRFMNGSVPFNSEFPAVEHKMLSLLYAIKLASFAEIKDDDHKIVTHPNGDSVYLHDHMSIVGSRITAGVTKEFQLKGQTSLRDLSFSRYIPNFSWMGKHFSISSKQLNKNRLYSICLSANAVVHARHNNILNNIEMLENGRSAEIKHLTPDELKSDVLELYVKRYDFPGTFSSYLHEQKIVDEDLTVKGPLGLGLDLSDEKLDGTYIAFSAGTGIYCFLDFVANVVRKVCHAVSTKLNCSNNTLVENEDFNLGDNFKLVLFCAYPDKENAFWHDIFLKTAALDEKHQIGIFSYFPRISIEQSKRWDRDFLRSSLESVKTSFLKKVFLCGPSQFLDSIKNNLIDGEIIHKDLITLV